ncbi:hypothetical protein SNEBB_004087 [Seison nebaliae]|nr:hypothetical protein SNEBB_004087 [Seison nebaliae]
MNPFTKLLLFLILIFQYANVILAEDGKLLVCYYTNWSQYRNGIAQFQPDDVDPHICTHIVYAFAKLDGNQLAAFEWNDDEQTWDIGNFKRIINLKKINPNLKILIALGGWNMASEPFTKVVENEKHIEEFVKSVIDFLRKRNFDGFDMDWEYPANRGSPPEDKQRFTKLIRDLRIAFEEEAKITGKERLLLTAAVGAGKTTIDSAYEIAEISKDLDLINLMTYDFHGPWETETGLNAPLYGRENESNDSLYLNQDFAVRYWIRHGASPSQLVMGIPTYGRGFTLENANNTKLGAAAKGPSKQDKYIPEPGIRAYYEMCQMEKEVDVTKVFNREHLAPYLYFGDQWIGYDDLESVGYKVQYLKDMHLAGAMVWSLDFDDFSGHCGGEKYPVIRHIQKVLHSTDRITTPVPVVTKEIDINKSTMKETVPPINPTIKLPITTEPPVTKVNSKSGSNLSLVEMIRMKVEEIIEELARRKLDYCKGKENGFYRDPNKCDQYIYCLTTKDENIYMYHGSCPESYIFNTKSYMCVESNNDECIDKGNPDEKKGGIIPIIQQTLPTNKPTYSTTQKHIVKQTQAPITNSPVRPQQPTSTIDPLLEIIDKLPTIPELPPGLFTDSPYPTTARKFECSSGASSAKAYANPNNCSQFFMCSNGQAIVRDCPPTLIFDPRVQSCNFATAVPSGVLQCKMN